MEKEHNCEKIWTKCQNLIKFLDKVTQKVYWEKYEFPYNILQEIEQNISKEIPKDFEGVLASTSNYEISTSIQYQTEPITWYYPRYLGQLDPTESSWKMNKPIN